MSELEIVYVLLIVMSAIAATLGRLWWESRESLKWKSVECAVLEADRDDMVVERKVFMQYAHVRAIAANIESGKARKK